LTLQVSKTALPEVLLIRPDVFGDDRGFFLETFHRDRYRAKGIDRVFVQDNHSRSTRGTLRGLHYQLINAQAKLVYVVSGEVLDVAADIRLGSPFFGQWVGTLLSEENRHQVFIPEGFAHGFCVLSESADVIYKCTEVYSPQDQHGIFWADPDLAIDWPVQRPVLSEKDSRHPGLHEISRELLPAYRALS
jgi:dTDP-4-dehydrorhamnose 3,5-epimerase